MQNKAQVAVSVSSPSAIGNMAGHSKTTSFSYFTSIELFVADTKEIKLAFQIARNHHSLTFKSGPYTEHTEKCEFKTGALTSFASLDSNTFTLRSRI